MDAFEAALSRWVASRLPLSETQTIASDGKTARGSRDDEVPGQHLVAAYCVQAQAVLAHINSLGQSEQMRNACWR